MSLNFAIPHVHDSGDTRRCRRSKLQAPSSKFQAPNLQASAKVGTSNFELGSWSFYYVGKHVSPAVGNAQVPILPQLGGCSRHRELAGVELLEDSQIERR